MGIYLKFTKMAVVAHDEAVYHVHFDFVDNDPDASPKTPSSSDEMAFQVTLEDSDSDDDDDDDDDDDNDGKSNAKKKSKAKGGSSKSKKTADKTSRARSASGDIPLRGSTFEDPPPKRVVDIGDYRNVTAADVLQTHRKRAASSDDVLPTSGAASSRFSEVQRLRTMARADLAFDVFQHKKPEEEEKQQQQQQQQQQQRRQL